MAAITSTNPLPPSPANSSDTKKNLITNITSNIPVTVNTIWTHINSCLMLEYCDIMPQLDINYIKMRR